jgi:hypothetical protein
MTRHPVAVTLFLALLTILYAGCERSEEKALPAAFPVTKVSVRAFTPFVGLSSWSQTVTLYVARETEIGSLVDLRVFGGLEPGITAEQAEARFGKANQTRTDTFGTTWYSYQTPLGHAEVGCDSRTSPAEDGKEVANLPCWWSLYAYTDQPVSRILREPVLSQLRAAEQVRSKVSDRSIYLVDSEGAPILQVWLKEGRISTMRLYKRLGSVPR